MRTLIRDQDLKRIYVGASFAVAAGLVMGTATQPRLIDGILAPQQQLPAGGQRSYADLARYSIADYGGQVPDYVIGTNYTRPPQLVSLPAPAHDEQAEAAYDAAEYGETAEVVAPGRWEDEPHEAPYYPSERGGAYNPSDLPEPPEPPVEEFEPL